jgi:outer membrane protein OmpA-like peptidoglycan-associated protein
MKNKLICIFIILLCIFYRTSNANQNDDNSILLPESKYQKYTILAVSSTTCADYKPKVSQAIRRSDLKSLKRLLTKLNKQPDCLISYLDNVKRSTAYIAARQAEALVKKGQLKQAEQLLKLSPTETWKTQVVRGDIAAYRKQWAKVVEYFNQALEFINDPRATSTANMPMRSQINEISQSILDAQLFAEDIIPTISLKSIDTTRSVPIPVQFKTNGYKLRDMTNTGKNSAQVLADYLNERNAIEVILYGHTDERGDASYNKWLSGKRAKSVKKYLQSSGGVRAIINTIAKGEEEPLPPPRWRNISLEEKYQRDRRVEFKIIR